MGQTLGTCMISQFATYSARRAYTPHTSHHATTERSPLKTWVANTTSMGATFLFMTAGEHVSAFAAKGKRSEHRCNKY